MDTPPWLVWQKQGPNRTEILLLLWNKICDRVVVFCLFTNDIFIYTNYKYAKHHNPVTYIPWKQKWNFCSVWTLTQAVGLYRCTYLFIARHQINSLIEVWIRIRKNPKNAVFWTFFKIWCQTIFGFLCFCKLNKHMTWWLIWCLATKNRCQKNFLDMFLWHKFVSYGQSKNNCFPCAVPCCTSASSV